MLNAVTCQLSDGILLSEALHQSLSDEWRYKGCVMSMTGWEYIGAQSTTLSGRTCLPWVGTDMEESGAFPDRLVPSARCRNPDLHPHGPWCYVDTGVREQCNIRVCSKTLNHLFLGHINIPYVWSLKALNHLLGLQSIVCWGSLMSGHLFRACFRLHQGYIFCISFMPQG